MQLAVVVGAALLLLTLAAGTATLLSRTARTARSGAETSLQRTNRILLEETLEQIKAMRYEGGFDPTPPTAVDLRPSMDGAPASVSGWSRSPDAGRPGG